MAKRTGLGIRTIVKIYRKQYPEFIAELRQAGIRGDDLTLAIAKIEKYTASEIGNILGVSTKTVSRRWHRLCHFVMSHDILANNRYIMNGGRGAQGWGS